MVVVVVVCAIIRCGNAFSAPQAITIVDSQDPVWISFPLAATVECSETPALSPADLGEPTATDACGLVTVTHADGPHEMGGHCGLAFAMSRTWIATDAYVFPGGLCVFLAWERRGCGD